jgi:hypothetical protein
MAAIISFMFLNGSTVTQIWIVADLYLVVWRLANPTNYSGSHLHVCSPLPENAIGFYNGR